MKYSLRFFFPVNFSDNRAISIWNLNRINFKLRAYNPWTRSVFSSWRVSKRHGVFCRHRRSYSPSAVLGKVRVERMTQPEFGALHFEHVATVHFFEIPPATAAAEHLVARSHHLLDTPSASALTDLRLVKTIIVQGLCECRGHYTPLGLRLNHSRPIATRTTDRTTP